MIRVILIGNRDYPLLPEATARVDRMAFQIIEWYEGQLGATAEWDGVLHAVELDVSNAQAWQNPWTGYSYDGVRAAGFDPTEHGVSWLAIGQGLGGWAGGTPIKNVDGSYLWGHALAGDWMLGGIEGYQVYDPETLAENITKTIEEPWIFGPPAHELGHAMLIGPHTTDPGNIMSYGGQMSFPDSGLSVDQVQSILSTRLFGPSPVVQAPPARPVVISLRLTPPRLSLRVGQSRTVKVQARMSDGSKVNATTFAQWTTLNPKVVVAELGTVAAIGTGRAGIFITFGGHDVVLPVEVR